MSLPDFTGKSVLITGGLGFIGSNLARQLVDLGALVTVLDAQLPNFGGNMFNLTGYENRLRINHGDLRDEVNTAQAVRGQDFIFNLAGQVSHLDSMQNPIADLEVNCHSQLCLLEACLRFNPNVRIVYTSTRQVYGRPQFLPVTEQHPLDPVDINGIHKLAVGRYHALYHQVYGLRTTTLRLTNTYGPRMRGRHFLACGFSKCWPVRRSSFLGMDNNSVISITWMMLSRRYCWLPVRRQRLVKFTISARPIQLHCAIWLSS